MSQQTGVALRFKAMFRAAKVGKTGLTVTVDVYENDSRIVTAAAAVEIGGGLYRYTLSSSANNLNGDYVAIFMTDDETVDIKHVPSLQETPSWADLIDVLISSRLAAADYDEVDVEGIEAQLVAIKARTDLISAGGITVASPFDPDTQRLTLVRGDDYPAGVHGLPAFTSEGWPDLTGATVRLTIRRRLLTGGDGAVLLSIEDTTGQRVAGTGEQSITFEPMSEANGVEEQEGSTDALLPGADTGVWDIEATLSNDTVKTLAMGRVSVLRDSTRPTA